MKHLAPVLAASVVLVPSVAFAQDIHEAFALGIDVPIVAYSSVSGEVENPPPVGNVNRDVSRMNWGVAENPMSLHLGYALSDDIVLGGMLWLGGDTRTYELANAGESKTTWFWFGIGPYFEYVFPTGGSVRPFIGGYLDISHESEDPDGSRKSSYTYFQLAARGGVHIFVMRDLSLDPLAFLGFQTVLSGEEDPGNFSVSGTGPIVGLGFGLTGWI